MQKLKTLNTLCKEELYIAFQKRAEAEKRSVASLLRIAVEKYLEGGQNA